MRLRSITFGRGIVLLILGIAVGTGLFLQSRLSPETLRDQVEAALEKMFDAPFELDEDQVEIQLKHGLVIHNLVIPYPYPYPGDGSGGRAGDAIRAEKIDILIDQTKLLAGEVVVSRVHIHGLTLRLRRDPTHGGVPSLPGILRPPDGDGEGEGPPPPAIVVSPGENGSWLILEDLGPTGAGDTFPQILNAARPLMLRCVDAKFDPDEQSITAQFEGGRLGFGEVTLSRPPDGGDITIDVELTDLSLERDDFAALAEELRGHMPPVRASGHADLEAHARFSADGQELREVTVDGRIHDVEGGFGNLFTGERHDYPFEFRNGHAAIKVRWPKMEIENFAAEYVSPSGRIGSIGANLMLDASYGWEFPRVAFKLHAENMEAVEFDMRRMLKPLLIEQVIDPFRTEGTFDIDVSVQKLPSLPENYSLEIRFRDATASFAGHLDKETRRRLGFEYPLSRGTGIVRYESNLVNSHGLYDRFELVNTRGYRPIVGARPGDPQEVEVKVRAEATFYTVPVGNPATHATVDIEVANLPIDARLDEAFKRAGIPVPYTDFNLTGWIRRLAIHIESDGWGENTPIATYTADLDGCTALFDPFPLGVSELTGRVVMYDRDPAGSEDSVVDLCGLFGNIVGGGHVGASGRIHIAPDGSRKRAVQIYTDDLPLGPALVNAFENSAVADSPLLDIWNELRPYGVLGCELDIVGDDLSIHVQLAGNTHLRGFRGVGLPIKHLKGDLTVSQAQVKIRDLSGTLGDASLWISGDVDDKGGLYLTGSIQNVLFTDPITRLLERVAPEGGKFLRTLALDPSSRADVALSVTRADTDSPTRINAEFTELVLATHVAGVPLSIRGGRIQLDDNLIEASGMHVTAKNADLFVRSFEIPRSLDGPGAVVLNANDLHPHEHLRMLLGPAFGESLGPNVLVDLKDFRIEFNRGDESLLLSGAVDLRRIRLTEEKTTRLEPTGLLGFSPLTIRLPENQGDPIQLYGVVEFEGVNFNVDVPIYDLSGELRISEGSIGDSLEFTGAVARASATAFGRRIDHAKMGVEFGPVFLRLQDMTAKFYGGDLIGAIAVHSEEPGGFDVDLQVTGASLSQLLKEEGIDEDEYSGSIDAKLQLQSHSNKVRHMRGRAEVRITEGRLLQIPGLRMVLGVLGRVAPFGESPRFNTAVLDVNVRGESLEVERLHLSTAVNDIHGYGLMTIHGDLDLLIFPQVTKAIDLPRFLDVPFLSAIGNAWFKNVNEIRIEGTIGSPALRRRALPILKSAPKSFTQSPHANFPRRVRPRVLPD